MQAAVCTSPAGQCVGVERAVLRPRIIIQTLQVQLRKRYRDEAPIPYVFAGTLELGVGDNRTERIGVFFSKASD